MQDNVEVRALLEQPFPQEFIKTRPGSFGKELSYVEGHEYVRRLNQAYKGDWSFEIVTHKIEENEVIVVGKLVADGIVKMSFGSSEITRRKDDGEIVSIGDDLKAASTDALKKASSLLGVGLHLYGDTPDEQHKPGNGNGKAAQTSGGNGAAQKNGGNGNGNGQSKAPGNGNGSANGDSRLTSRQHSYIKSLAGEKGIDEGQLEKMSLERYGKKLSFVTKNDASALIGELQGA